MDVESEASELDKGILDAQGSDPDFSDEEARQRAEDSKAQFENPSDEEEESSIEVSNPILFTEHLPVMGRVPISKSSLALSSHSGLCLPPSLVSVQMRDSCPFCTVFFLPDVEESIKLRQRIEMHGGRVIEQFECNSYQIRPTSKTELDFNFFYNGAIYDASWILDSISVGRLLAKEEYFLSANDSPTALKLNIAKRKRITIVEGMKLYKALGAGKYSKVSNETYKGIERQGYLPERSAETMKNFWKENHAKPLEQYLVEAIFFKWDYCFSFKEIPNEEFEDKHRAQFAAEFEHLEAKEMNAMYPTPAAATENSRHRQQMLRMERSDSEDDDEDHDIFDDRTVVRGLEKQQAMPKQGVSSTFKLGYAFGQITTTVALSRTRYTMVTPVVWKRAMNLPKDKDAARRMAQQWFPDRASELKRKKDEHRAEALLIALYGRGKA